MFSLKTYCSRYSLPLERFRTNLFSIPKIFSWTNVTYIFVEKRNLQYFYLSIPYLISIGLNKCLHKIGIYSLFTRNVTWHNKSEYFSVQLENVLLKIPPKTLRIQKIRLGRKKIIANVPFDIIGMNGIFGFPIYEQNLYLKSISPKKFYPQNKI